ncbi:MAG: tRNA (guanine(37)-N(1))-methyltransferase, partial [Desulfovibrionaceae bacterium]|nr:tRNA (guanine(37)-N(1))-methyltransferase [Desulfovibrionaceae bacterium]
MLQIHLVTLFPDFYTSPLNCGLMQKAREAGIIDFSFHNPRTYSLDRHHHVDDAPYGGGPGMLMQIEPLAKCLAAIERPGPIICLTPRGKPLTQKMVREWASEDDLTFICARYEGLDERLFDLFPCESVAVTDAVLNSGDSAALVVIEACARLRPGFMGKDYSSCEESFSCDLLEYP